MNTDELTERTRHAIGKAIQASPPIYPEKVEKFREGNVTTLAGEPGGRPGRAGRAGRTIPASPHNLY